MQWPNLVPGSLSAAFRSARPQRETWRAQWCIKVLGDHCIRTDAPFRSFWKALTSTIHALRKVKLDVLLLRAAGQLSQLQGVTPSHARLCARIVHYCKVHAEIRRAIVPLSWRHARKEALVYVCCLPRSLQYNLDKEICAHAGCIVEIAYTSRQMCDLYESSSNQGFLTSLMSTS